MSLVRITINTWPLWRRYTVGRSDAGPNGAHAVVT